MKKVMVVICVGLFSMMAWAQNQKPKTVSEKVTQLETALERQIAQAQQTQTVGNFDLEHATPAVATPAEEHPSYYVNKQVYQVCKSVSSCEEWASKQAQKEVHFQVVAASLVPSEDLHHSRLIVKYITYQDPIEKIFEEDFSGWKEK